MKNTIDIHVHLAAFPTEKNGGYMSPAFQKGVLVKLVKWKLGLSGNTPEEMNDSYVKKLLNDMKASQFVDKAVLLALDGVYDDHGKLDQEKTHMVISNDHVRNLSKEFPNVFLYGASVNPQRRDAIDELHRVIEDGAKLIKVLPPSQVFDPLNKKYEAYYRVLADKKIPFLCHVGYEFSVTAGKQEYGFPDRLKLALDNGVIVIGAHACSSAVFTQRKFFETFLNLVQEYPNFYSDLSAVTLPNRASVVYHLKKHPEVFDRLVFGSDYPLSSYATPFLGSLSIGKQWQLWRTKNIFDKHAQVLKEMKINFDPKTTEKLLKVDV